MARIDHRGIGHGRAGSGAYKGAYSFGSRFRDEKGTNPEELIGAAHAGCFSMALTLGLGRAGFPPSRIHTTAKVEIEQTQDGFRITRIGLDTEVEAPGLDASAFQAQAEAAKKDCPVSRALTGVEVLLNARLITG
ncbi:MAG: OsmC family peroxiredoxin [Caulobacteraceae bacterium]